jgi:hypothetical protein
MEALFTAYGIWGLIIVVLAVLAALMPVFVLKIRNETISINKKLSKIIMLLEGSEDTTLSKLTKVCPFCQTKNKALDLVCTNCGKAMGL